MITLKRNSKQYTIAIIFFAIEGLFFLRFRNGNREMFFMVWIFIYLTLILYSFLNFNSSYNINKIGKSESARYGGLSSGFNEISNMKNSKPSSNSNGFLGALIVFLIINIMGYLILQF